MQYTSTRGEAPQLDFGDVLLTGLASDGGLYLPESWPQLDLHDFGPNAPYADIAVDVMWPFVEGAIDRGAFEEMVADAYASFEHPDVTPLVHLEDDLWLLELFHGPTLAFKDVALQLVGRLFDYELSKRSDRITIVGATSGDTGSAAIEACRDREAVDIFILHPHGRVSEVQRRQMTTVDSSNVFNIAVEGTFDDCQDLVKAMFADEAFRSSIRLGAVNSINWARVMAQIVYYVVAAQRFGTSRPINFAVPTGNFGNVFAGWAARQMGLATNGFIVGSNRNDILARFFESGELRAEDVVPSLSPSMDIQVSSNLERLLFELYGRNGSMVADMMTTFRAEKNVRIDEDHYRSLREQWQGARIDDDGEHGTKSIIADVYERTNMILDPHTAVGVGAARKLGVGHTTVALATAHPAKFPDAVEAAIGIRPELPSRLGDLFDRTERYDVLANDLASIQQHITARARITTGS